MPVDEEESLAAWQALLAGLTELCAGLGAALRSGGPVEEDELSHLMPPGSLNALLLRCPGVEARQAVWRIAQELPFLPAAAELHETAVQVGA